MDHNLSLIKALVTTLHIEIETLDDKSQDSLEESIDLAEKVREYEAKLIKAALLRTGGNQRRAAKMLNIKTSTLHSKIKLHKITVIRERSLPDLEAQLRKAA